MCHQEKQQIILNANELSPSDVPEGPSTSIGDIPVRFWNEHIEEKSRKLWLPTEIDSPILPPNSSSGNFVSVERNSWFNIMEWEHRNPNWSKICSRSSRFSLADKTDDGDTKKPKRPQKPKDYKDLEDRKFHCDQCDSKFKTKSYLTKHLKSHRVGNYITRKIRLYPDAEDREVLRRWFGIYRRFYNDAIVMMKQTGVEKYEAFHGKLTSGKNIVEPWKFLLPSRAMKCAVRDACAAVDSNRKKQMIDPSHHFEMKLRTRKDAVQQIQFEATTLKVLGTVGKIGKLQIGDAKIRQLGKLGITFRTSSEIDDRKRKMNNADYIRRSADPILQLDKLNRFYLILRLWEQPLDTQERDPTVKVVSIDPGVRTFATTFSPDGTMYKLGDRAASRIYRLMIADDEIQGILERKKRIDGSRTSAKERRKLRRSRCIISDKICHLTDEMHWKIVRFLVDRYDHIIIPPFESAKMSRRYDIARQRRRKIGKKTVRQMLRLRHFAFRQKLLYVAGRRGVVINVLDEVGTTKTCTNCGYWDAEIGGKKKYRCRECNVHCDRDVNGGRNIFLKHMDLM